MCKPNEPDYDENICRHPSKEKLLCKNCKHYNEKLPETAYKVCKQRGLLQSNTHMRNRHDDYLKWLLRFIQTSNPPPHLHALQKSALLQSLNTGDVNIFCRSLTEDNLLHEEQSLYGENCLETFISSDDPVRILESLSICYEKHPNFFGDNDFELIKVFLRCARIYPFIKRRVAYTLKALIMGANELSEIDASFCISTILEFSKDFLSAWKLLINCDDRSDVLSMYSTFYRLLLSKGIEIIPNLDKDIQLNYVDGIKNILINKLKKGVINTMYSQMLYDLKLLRTTI